MEDRLPPHSIEAEEALIGSILIDPDVFLDKDQQGMGITDRLKPGMFYREQNRWIYGHMVDMFMGHEAIDLITLSDRLRKAEQLEEIGGDGYIIGLLNVVPTSINALHYAKIIEGTAIRRALIYQSAKIASLAYDETVDPGELITTAESLLMDIDQDSGQSTMKGPKQLANEYMAQFDIDESRPPKIILTGFKELDEKIVSVEEGLWIIMGRAGMGKTTAALSMMENMDAQGLRVAIFSLEMSSTQLMDRFISAKSGIPSQLLRKARLGKATLSPRESLFYEAVALFSEGHIYVDEISRCSPAYVRSRLLRAMKTNPFDVCFIDFLQLMGTDEEANNRNLEIGAVTRELKILSHEMHLPIFAISQVNRKVEDRQDKRPGLADLRDSGEIEQNADAVISVYRDEVYYPESTQQPGNVELAPLKDRLSGMDTTPMNLYHDKAHGRIIDYEKTKKGRRQ